MHPVPRGRHFFPESWPPGGPLASGCSAPSLCGPLLPVPSGGCRMASRSVQSSDDLQDMFSGPVSCPPRPATAPAMFLRPRQQHLGAVLWPLGGASVTRRLQGPRSREGRVPGQGRAISGSRVAFRGPGGDREAWGSPRRILAALGVRKALGGVGLLWDPGSGGAAPRGPRPRAAGPARQPCDRAGILGWRPVLFVY